MVEENAKSTGEECKDRDKREAHWFNWAGLIPVRNHRKIQLQVKTMKPAVLRQTTDKADALWRHREMRNFKTFKLEREEKNNWEESLDQKQ